MNRYTALILALLMALLCVLPVSLAEETATAETEATEAPAAVEQGRSWRQRLQGAPGLQSHCRGRHRGSSISGTEPQASL